MALTPKQEAFALAYIETGNASEAYRRSYDAARSKPEVIHVNACKLLASTKVAIRVEELRQAIVDRSQITVDDLIRELEEARDGALNARTPQNAAAVAATMGKAKLLGFLTDRIDATVSTRQLPASVDEFV